MGKPGVRNELLGPPKLGVFRSLGKAFERPGGYRKLAKVGYCAIPTKLFGISANISKRS